MSGAEQLTGAAYWLPLICAGVVVLAVALYVVLDGFDLGIGILFPFFPQEADRDRMMNSVAPFWDGNETWLVLGGNGLFVAFPVAYAIIMPALYVPLIIMLLALVFRGVAFEFRWVAKPSHRMWDIAFAGGPFDWLTPFTLLCGVGLLLGYALLGACWLVMKTTDELEQRCRKLATPLLAGLIATIVLVSIWTPLEYERVAERWFSLPNLLYLSPVPLITAVLVVMCWRGIRRGHATTAFYSAVALFVVAFFGLVISMYPYLVPTAMTLWDAAASPESQTFLLIGTAVLVPFILGYTVFVYYTFRGKIRVGEGYH